jgi:hypothetical protein
METGVGDGDLELKFLELISKNDLISNYLSQAIMTD